MLVLGAVRFASTQIRSARCAQHQAPRQLVVRRFQRKALRDGFCSKRAETEATRPHASVKRRFLLRKNGAETTADNRQFPTTHSQRYTKGCKSVCECQRTGEPDARSHCQKHNFTSSTDKIKQCLTSKRLLS